jgi:hypothetical protein
MESSDRRTRRMSSPRKTGGLRSLTRPSRRRGDINRGSPYTTSRAPSLLSRAKKLSQEAKQSVWPVWQKAMTLSDRQRMQCPTCRRELGDREPVYQVRRLPPPYPGIVHVCRKCEEERHQGWVSATGRYLRTEPCDSCERPVLNLARLARRYRRSIIACSLACRKRIENARYPAKRYGHPTRRPCATCGAPFTPKRSEGLYCSSRCKQRAYRRRV